MQKDITKSSKPQSPDDIRSKGESTDENTPTLGKALELGMLDHDKTGKLV